MAIKKITKRWLLNSFGVILVILIALEIAFAIGIRGYYYSGILQAVKSRASTSKSLLTSYAQDSSVNFSSQIRNMVSGFADKDKMELMAISHEGEVIITSSGFEPEGKYYMPDFDQAMENHTEYGEYRGIVNGENILAVTLLSPVQDENLAALRFVVSLTAADNQIITMVALITLLGIAVILLVILSSSYFISSIVKPVGQVGETARKIAQGNFDVRLKKANDDEVGELCDVINYMAEELSTTEKLKNDFISSVSHELRTPLTAIKGWGETLKEDGCNDPEMMKKGMTVILNETDRLSQMVEDLLDFSRMQSGRFKLVFDKTDLLAELGEAVLMFTERAKREGISLIYNEPDLYVTVMGDKNRLRQVFINIIDNALKYSDSGDSVTIDAFRDREDVVIAVADTGCGIKAEDLAKVKTKFFKGNSTRRGSGIGLAVADEIISLHGGSLELDSVEQEGTTVTIRIPIFKRSEDLPKLP